MAKKARKKPRKSRVRSIAARKGWQTRRLKARKRTVVFRRRSLSAKKGWQTRRLKARKRTVVFRRRSLSAKKGSATRRLKRSGVEKLPNQRFGIRRLEYEYYTIPVLSVELIQDVIDAAAIDSRLFSVALRLEIYEERTKDQFTNQTAFVLYDEPGAAETLTNDAAEVVSDPSPDITEFGRKKPHYSLVGVTVVIQRSMK